MQKRIRKKTAILMTLLLCLSMADFSALITAYAEETEEIAETADSIDESMDDTIAEEETNESEEETTEYEHSYGEYTLKYTVEDNNAVITGYTGELPSELEIPGTIDGYKVVMIGEEAFTEANITSVVIPDGVKTIGYGSFARCEQLASVQIPNSVTEIVAETFSGCSSLVSVEIPDSVLRIEAATFSDCSSLERINIPDGVTEIEFAAFSDCKSLKEITLPDSLQEIYFGAFDGCSSLISVDIPDSVVWIGNWTFCDCSSLESINIPNGVTTIEVAVFSGCESLSEITLPSTLQRIYEDAFSRCKKLTLLQIPASVTHIDEGAFSQSGISEIYFSGNAPEFSYDEEDPSIFKGDTLTAFYPVDNPTWTEDVLQPYGADSIEWIPWNPETEEIQGYIDVVDDSVDGENEIGVHIIGSGDDLVLECNLPLQYFVSVEIDGVTVDPSNYELRAGSTIITFDSSFLDTLTPGNHTVTMHYNINGRKVAVKTSITIKKSSESSGKPSKPDTPSKPADSFRPVNGNNTGTKNETTASSQNKVTMKAYLVDANGQPMYNCTLEIHSKPVAATLGTDGTASFKNIEVGEHTMYLKDQNGKELASKAIKIVHDQSYSITGGDTIHVVKGRAFILNVKYDGENLILLSVEGDQTPDTGDRTSMNLWILLMVLSAAGMVLVIARKREQNGRF